MYMLSKRSFPRIQNSYIIWLLGFDWWSEGDFDIVKYFFLRTSEASHFRPRHNPSPPIPTPLSLNSPSTLHSTAVPMEDSLEACVQEAGSAASATAGSRAQMQKERARSRHAERTEGMSTRIFTFYCYTLLHSSFLLFSLSLLFSLLFS